MSRIRSLHPGLFTDDRYMGISLAARELLKGLWCEADDQGVFEWRPLTLKARIMPADAVDVGNLLSELSDAMFVSAFDEGGKRYGAIRNFRKFQRPKRPTKSYPLPAGLRNYVGLPGEHSAADDDDGGNDPHGSPAMGGNGYVHPTDVPPIAPPCGGNPPQMEDEGEGEGSKNLPPADSESEAARADGGRAGDEGKFEGRAIRLEAAGLAECRAVYPFDDMETRLRVYDAKFAERAEFPPLSRVLAWLAQDVPRRRAGRIGGDAGLSDPADTEAYDQQLKREAYLRIFAETGQWNYRWGEPPTTAAGAA